MKKQYYFLAALMLGLFSSVGFASTVGTDSANHEHHKEMFSNNTFIDGDWIGNPGKKWLKDKHDHNGSGGGNHWGWGNGAWENWNGHHSQNWHDEHHGHHDHGPSTVPLPAAVWLFGSVLLGLAGLKRKS